MGRCQKVSRYNLRGLRRSPGKMLMGRKPSGEEAGFWNRTAADLDFCLNVQNHRESNCRRTHPALENCDLALNSHDEQDRETREPDEKTAEPPAETREPVPESDALAEKTCTPRKKSEKPGT